MFLIDYLFMTRQIDLLVSTYGYWAIFFGTLFEGETILLAAGYAAQLGLLEWPFVVAVAFIGGTLGDQIAFILGRWKGYYLLRNFPSLANHAPHINHLLHRYQAIIIFSIRFLYGLRIAGPVIIGMSRIPFLRFSLLNILAAFSWAVIVAGAGYYFGVALESILSDINQIEHWVILGVLVAALIGWLWLSRRVNRLDSEDRRN
jgi:membrane protein DedA with SNARE-associated domain